MSRKTVGIVGVPPRTVMTDLFRSGVRIVDLDEPQVRASLDETAPYLPRVYCAILRTVVLNTLHLDLDQIVNVVGPGKCDCALHVAAILEQRFGIEVIRTRNQDRQGNGYPLCRARMNLREKMTAITAGLRDPAPGPAPESCRPTAGFWGVPPRDFSLLDLFPDTTHIYGWTRCLENRTPADLELESHVNRDVPTVFFAQSFCAKTALARHLAATHPRALFLDCDVTASSSVRAKIEAFLELNSGDRAGALSTGRDN